MAKIVVFDSGLGSLSIIRSLRKKTKSEIIYFADHKNFPYGKKPITSLQKIIKNTINGLKQKFDPALIVLGSNTPSLLFENLLSKDKKIIKVLPPLYEASKLSKSSSIAILTTKSVIESNALKNYIKKHVGKKTKVTKINASLLVELVESGKFIHNEKLCKKKIGIILKRIFLKNEIDVVTLSSTHLPFLLPIFEELFPDIKFLDPANEVAEEVKRILKNKKSKYNSMKIFTSGNANKFQQNLTKLGIKSKVQTLNFN